MTFEDDRKFCLVCDKPVVGEHYAELKINNMHVISCLDHPPQSLVDIILEITGAGEVDE